MQVSNQIFNKMGLQLDTLKIQRVEDEASYLSTWAERRLPMQVRDAENAEKNQANQNRAVEAAARQLAEVAQKMQKLASPEAQPATVSRRSARRSGAERSARSAGQHRSNTARAGQSKSFRRCGKDLNQRKAVRGSGATPRKRISAQLLHRKAPRRATSSSRSGRS